MTLRSLRFRITAWYAGLLAGSLILFGTALYLGLRSYLYRTLANSLTAEARSIGAGLLEDVGTKGPAYVTGEIGEQYDPETNARFIRVTRGDGRIFYQSGAPKNGSFDPAKISPAPGRPAGETTRIVTGAGRSPVLIADVPYVSPAGQRYWTEFGASMEPTSAVLHGLLLVLVLGMPVVVAAAIGGGYVLMRRALSPVDEITRQAERISSQNLGERLQVAKTGDELERLATALNRMLARLEDSFQHINRFSADASHELRTPLTILRGELEAVARQPGIPADLLEPVGSALEETERLAKIVDNLLAISRLDAGDVQMEVARLDLGELVVSTAEQLHLLAEEKGIAIRYRVTPSVEVQADASRLKQVVVNLFDNAIKYTGDGGRVDITVTAQEGKGLLEVADNGVGISPAALPHVFERFYRADRARSRASGGAGLGLAIVKAICAALNGEVRIVSAEGQGTCVRVELPLAEVAGGADRTPRDKGRADGAPNRVHQYTGEPGPEKREG
ncbi:MAG TPA: ATP-binding protein [Candidatus Acidoferrales bacterium]|nr:ATP-binding protein [Candidatus Acidoferrales bacterium]